MNPEVFYLHIRGEQRGPYTIPQIDHLLNSGLIEPDTLFWREGLEQWQPVTNLVTLRKPVRRWLKPAIALGCLLFLLLLAKVFGPTVRLGWRETNQHEFTASGAYWRARDFIRHQGLPAGNTVNFAPYSLAQIKMHEPDGAVAVVRGTLFDGHGNSHAAAWEVTLSFDQRLKEWSSVSVKEAPNSP